MGTEMLHCPTLAPPSGHCASMLSKTVRAFDCHPADVREPNAGDLDRLTAPRRALKMYHCKADADEIGYCLQAKPSAE